MEKTLACVCRLLNWNFKLFIGCRSLWTGSSQHLLSLTHDTQTTLEEIDEALSRAEHILRSCREKGLDILYPGDDYYPNQFLQLSQPPVYLNYFGEIELLARDSLSVVGSRQPLPWVEGWLEQEFFQFISETKRQVISGGAIGIDQLAHSVALRAKSTSLAILPSGLNNLYPKSLIRFNKFIESGNFGFLTEYLPDQVMAKHHFYLRNRLISAFSKNLFVVQAHLKSGSMITAQYAIDQGKEVISLPGSPMEPATQGNLQLLFDGAQMVRWGSDLLNSNFYE